MSDEELEAEMKNRGIEILDDEEGEGSATGGGSDKGDYTEELEKIAGLRDKGILTEEEFQAKKKQILGL